MKEKYIWTAVILVGVFLCIGSTPVLAQDSFAADWAKAVKKAKTYAESSRNYWTIPEFKQYVAMGGEILPLLEKTYIHSNDHQERMLALHLIGEISRDADRVWSLFSNNDLPGSGQRYHQADVTEYLKNYRHPEFIRFCAQNLRAGHLAHPVLHVYAWQGDESRVAEVMEYFTDTNDPEALLTLGQIGGMAAEAFLRAYAQNEDQETSKTAITALALMKDREAVATVYHRFYLLQDYSQKLNSHSVLQGTQSREVIDWLIEDAVKESVSMAILARITGICRLQGDANPDILELSFFFSQNPFMWEKELNVIRNWWSDVEAAWVEPEKRIYIGPQTPVLGGVPKDLMWLDPWTGYVG